MSRRSLLSAADDEGFRDRSSFKLPATPAEVPSWSPPESSEQPAPADSDGSSAAFAASSGLELVQDSEDEDSEEEDSEEDASDEDSDDEEDDDDCDDEDDYDDGN